MGGRGAGANGSALVVRRRLLGVVSADGHGATAAARRYGRTRCEMLQELDGMLERPFPYATEFYLFDKLKQLATPEQPFVDVEALLQHAANPAIVDRHRVSMMLSAGMRCGALEKDRQTPGYRGKYRVTAKGLTYLAQSKQMRIGLWEINPGMGIAEICAIVQLERSDALTEMLLDDDTVDARTARRPTPNASQDGHGHSEGGSGAWDKVHPLWAGLMVQGAR